MSISVTFEPPSSWVIINREKLNRWALLAAYEIHERTGGFIERMEAHEDDRPAKQKRRASKQSGKA